MGTAGGGGVRAIWSGSLAFGLVNIPVRLYNATSPKDVRFHEFEGETGRRVHYQRVVSTEPGLEEEPDESSAESPLDDPREASDATAATRVEPSQPVEVAYEDIVKGYEVAPERYVMVATEELEELRPEQTRSIEIDDFVDLSHVDPVYFEKSYFVVPARGAERPYALLRRALEETNRAGIARFVLRRREHLAAIWAASGIVRLETLFYADEVRNPGEVAPPDVDVSDRELDVAKQLVGFLAAEWEPSRYRDTYRERVLELIGSRVAGDQVVREERQPEPASRVPDLLSALRASVEEAKRAREAAVEPKARSRKSGRTA
jgi:DNA end-binding protein Ku